MNCCHCGRWKSENVPGEACIDCSPDYSCFYEEDIEKDMEIDIGI